IGGEGSLRVVVHRRTPVETIDPIGVLDPGDNGEWITQEKNHGPNVVNMAGPDCDIGRVPREWTAHAG
ncbi:MAG: hypothetical protein WBN93_07825, partial [Acidimicrobiia bacterium]